MASTSFFALGLILITQFTASVDLDQDCVLYGELLYIPFNTFTWLNIQWGPGALYTSGFVFLLVLTSLILGYKGLKITSFQSEYAASLGLHIAFWHYGLMGITSLVTVFSFESVGALLVVGFLVIPGACAWLLFKDLKKLLIAAGIVSILSCFLGYGLALVLNTALAPAIGTTMGAFFLLAFIMHVILAKGMKNKLH